MLKKYFTLFIFLFLFIISISFINSNGDLLDNLLGDSKDSKISNQVIDYGGLYGK